MTAGLNTNCSSERGRPSVHRPVFLSGFICFPSALRPYQTRYCFFHTRHESPCLCLCLFSFLGGSPLTTTISFLSLGNSLVTRLRHHVPWKPFSVSLRRTDHLLLHALLYHIHRSVITLLHCICN